jgi:hypothetical protein
VEPRHTVVIERVDLIKIPLIELYTAGLSADIHRQLSALDPHAPPFQVSGKKYLEDLQEKYDINTYWDHGDLVIVFIPR